MTSTYRQVSLPDTMKALRIEEFNASPPYVLRNDVPVPRPGPNDVLLKIATAGYCHTEIMVASGQFASKSRNALPLTPSHEPTGVVVALGENAAHNPPGNSQGKPLQVGDRVGCITFRDFCNKCNECKRGTPRYCTKQDMVGVTADGAFAEYMIGDYRSCVVLPDRLDFEAAAPLFCAGATVFSAIKSCKLESGQTLAIIGAGALGHLGVQFAKCLGYKTWLFDARDAPLKMCQGLPYPPDAIYNSGKVDAQDQDQIDRIIEELGGSPADATIVATDVLAAFEFGLAITKSHGLLVVVGQPEKPIPIHYNHFIFRDITVKGSLLGDPATTKEMCDLVAEKGIQVRTNVYRLEDINKLMEDYHKEDHQGKMVVRIGDEK
ncbi:GroES-like protein [Testicularia cyperi]|uniref:GroES-like protein n=1 Tax=Testicularia cyperi TaxID=1882483 RepID=A0A317XUS9_9BASI|nr:GroES-like protein [Testicularia cyperi]